MASDVESDHFRRMRWLSPNSCHRYPVAIAARYASMTCGSPINAESIARWLVTGSWKPVSNPSTDRTGFPGRTKRRVNPCRGRTPSGVQADSSARTTVVPMAMTRCPPSRVRLTRSAAAAETSNGSGYTACASTWSVDLKAAYAGVKEDGREPDSRGFKGLPNLRGDRSRRRRHLCTPGYAREQALVRV